VTPDSAKREGGGGDSAGHEEAPPAGGAEFGHAARVPKWRRGARGGTPRR
jgi:hypothetical protein